MNVIIGNRASGKPYSLNLSKAFPLLIEGDGGSGKSYLVATILSELINKFSPEDLKLCLVNTEKDDRYSPYLMTPARNTTEDVPALLTLIDHEMRERYYAFSLYGAKNFEDYKVKGYPKLPYILVVFDEFDSLSSAHRQTLEPELIFLIRMLKATGIYLAIATESDSIGQFMETQITILEKGGAEVKFSKKRDVITII